MQRRDFIRLSTLAGGGLLLSFSNDVYSKDTTLLQDPTGEVALGNFLKITPTGEVLFQLTKHEMGQGVSTGLAMILAEELCADWRNVKIEWTDADLKKYQNQAHGGFGTGGSTTTSDMWKILRKAGAAARHLLIEAAAGQWKTKAVNCRAENHWVINTLTNDRLGFGELASKAALLTLPETLSLKRNDQFTLVGTAQPGKLIKAMVTGAQKYGIDVNVEGMLYAVVARCPVYRGQLKSFDATETLKVSGVKKVVTTQSVAGVKGHYFYHIREGVAVIADSFWAAKKGREKLIIEWDEQVGEALEAFEQKVEKKARQRNDPTGFIGDDNAISNLLQAKKTLRATYVYPYQLHSFMEPLNCTASFNGDTAEIWVGTQAGDYMISEIAKTFGLNKDDIKVHLFPSGGGFGRRWYPDAAIEAICISKEAGNIPIKLMWTREDDQQTSMLHGYTHSNYQASLNANNELTSWYHKELRTYTWGSKVADPEITWIGYDIPNIRYDFENLLEESLVQSCAWRAVIANAWGFGQECFVDELAFEMKKDPFEFRMSLLREGRETNVGHGYPLNCNRLRNVVQLAAEKSGWGKTLQSNQGMGIAAYPYMHGNSYCAIVAEVTCVNGSLSVDKVTCAVDCGLVVNPSAVKNQIEGGVVWALTALLYGGVNIERGRLTNSNFHQNKLLRMKECPTTEVHFVDSTESTPWGIGELAPPAALPAVVNAIFAATGRRIRKLPIQPGDIA